VVAALSVLVLWQAIDAKPSRTGQEMSDNKRSDETGKPESSDREHTEAEVKVDRNFRAMRFGRYQTSEWIVAVIKQADDEASKRWRRRGQETRLTLDELPHATARAPRADHPEFTYGAYGVTVTVPIMPSAPSWKRQ
jgi:hypothetical protein